MEPNYKFSSMGSGSGSERVRTTEPAIFISKNHENNTRSRKLIENNQRGRTDSGGVCVAREGGGSRVEDAFPVCIPVCECQVVRDA